MKIQIDLTGVSYEVSSYIERLVRSLGVRFPKIKPMVKGMTFGKLGFFDGHLSFPNTGLQSSVTQAHRILSQHHKLKVGDVRDSLDAMVVHEYAHLIFNQLDPKPIEALLNKYPLTSRYAENSLEEWFCEQLTWEWLYGSGPLMKHLKEVGHAS